MSVETAKVDAIDHRGRDERAAEEAVPVLPWSTCNEASFTCFDAQGRPVATLHIVPHNHKADDGIVELTEAEAARLCEPRLQLRERCTYQYVLQPAGAGARLCIRSDHATRFRLDAVQPPGGELGTLTLKDHCGLLVLDVHEAPSGPAQSPRTYGPHVGHVAIQVRSVKIGASDDARQMLADIGRHAEALLLDSRSNVRAHFGNPRPVPLDDPTQQLEFLRSTIESPAFQGALAQILRAGHRRLEPERRDRPVGAAGRPDRHLARELVTGGRRVPLPAGHPLRAQGLASVPGRVTMRVHADDFDTPENRFV